jgi:hypothetical protein
MTDRGTLYGWIARHRLDPERSRALFRLAGYGQEPPALAHRFWSAVAIGAAALGGFGLLLWLAANWNDFGRGGRFALLQGAVLVLCAGAALQRRARAPLGLMALLCIGGLFAWFGQTYQTGADPWQLFALWALLSLPLCLAVRSDVLWAPWALVASIGLALWLHAHTGHRWRVEPQELPLFLAAWLGSGLLVLGLGPAAAQRTGAGPWALRTAGTCSVALVGTAALGGLFQSPIASPLCAPFSSRCPSATTINVFAASAAALSA